MNIQEIYGSHLQAALTRAGMNKGQIDAIMHKFQLLASKGNPELSFRVMQEAYANECTEKTCKKIKDVIQESLERFSREHGSIEANPLFRLRDYIKRFNAAVEKCAVKVNGQDMTKEELEAAKLKEPSWAKSSTPYTATASHKGKVKELTISVKF